MVAALTAIAPATPFVTLVLVPLSVPAAMVRMTALQDFTASAAVSAASAGAPGVNAQWRCLVALKAAAALAKLAPLTSLAQKIPRV